MIELKNIDLENVTLKEQYKKAAEEYRIAFYMRLNSCNIFKINKGQTLFI